jgi:hypothetical protein
MRARACFEGINSTHLPYVYCPHQQYGSFDLTIVVLIILGNNTNTS